MYTNYEILCNAFACKIIDLSKADIYLIKSTEMGSHLFKEFLIEQNEYSLLKCAERYEKIEKIREIDE